MEDEDFLAALMSDGDDGDEQLTGVHCVQTSDSRVSPASNTFAALCASAAGQAAEVDDDEARRLAKIAELKQILDREAKEARKRQQELEMAELEASILATRQSAAKHELVHVIAPSKVDRGRPSARPSPCPGPLETRQDAPPVKSFSERFNEKAAEVKKPSNLQTSHRVSIHRNSAADDGADDDELTDPYSRLRIKNRVISKALLASKFAKRKVLAIPDIERHLRGNEVVGDWIAIGVIVHKTDPKSSSSSDKYCMMRLSVLTPDSMNLFLYNEAFTEHWKTLPGTVIALLNPEILKPTDKGACYGLKIRNDQQLLVIGKAMDYGFCRAMRNDGLKCNNVLNTRKSEYCEFHISKAYKKAKLERPQFSTTSSLPNLQRKVTKAPDASYVINGKVVSSQASASARRSNSVRQNDLDKKILEACFKTNSIGARNALALSRPKDDGKSYTSEKRHTASLSQSAFRDSFATAAKRDRPMDVELSSDEEDTKELPVSLQNAIVTKQHCNKNFEPFDPNQAFRNKGGVNKDELIARKAAAAKAKRTKMVDLDDILGDCENKPVKPAANSLVKQKTSEENLFGVDLGAEKSKKLLAQGSKFGDDAKEDELNNWALECDYHEKKEAMEIQMSEIKDKQVVKWFCKDCQKSTTMVLPSCSQQHHDVRREKIRMYFFKCVCGHRVESSQSLPSYKCPRCSKIEWKRTTQHTVAKISAGPLVAARGVEHNKFFD